MEEGEGEVVEAVGAGLKGVALQVGEVECALEVVGAEVAFEVVGIDVIDAVHYPFS